MLSVAERVFFITKVPLFAQLDRPTKARLASVAEEVVFKPGELLFRQGDPGDTLYLLLDGEVAIELGGTEVNRMRPGDSFGEVAILDRGRRTADARADGDVLALRIDRRAVEDLLASYPQLRLAIVNQLGARLRAINQRLRTLRA